MKIFKKEREVIDLAMEYLDALHSCVTPAHTAVVSYLKDDPSTMEKLYPEVAALESRADEIRRAIADLLYSGAYLPLMRADIYAVIESLDSVPNAAEACCGFFCCEKPDIPSEFKEPFLNITDASFSIVDPLRKAVKTFFKPKGKIDAIREHAKAAGVQESEIDALERDLTIAIFQSPSLELAQKNHLKRALDRIVHIPDRVEDAAETLSVVAMKSIL